MRRLSTLKQPQAKVESNRQRKHRRKKTLSNQLESRLRRHSSKLTRKKLKKRKRRRRLKTLKLRDLPPLNVISIETVSWSAWEVE